MFGGRQLFTFVGGSTAGVAEVTTASTTIHTFTIPFRCTPLRAGVTVTIAPGTTAPTLTFGAAGICGIVIVPLTATAGQVYYQETDYVAAGTGVWTGSLSEGAQVAVVVSNNSSGTGSVIPWLLVEVNPERPANNSAMVKTT